MIFHLTFNTFPLPAYLLSTRLDGRYREWYTNGQLKKEYFSQNGLRQGFMKTYTKNGKLKCNDWYVNDWLALKNVTYAKAITDRIDTIKERMPQFPGGDEKFYEFLKCRSVYPNAAMLEEKEGKVILGFIVDKDGYISNVTIIKGLSTECDEEAKRVVESMPPWEPGIQNGKRTACHFTLPIVFAINSSVIID